MKSYIVLFGCLALVSSAYSWIPSKKLPCPTEPNSCFVFKNAIDAQARRIICQSDIVTDISFSYGECGKCGKIRFNKVHLGKNWLNGTELTVALRSDCDELPSKEKLCLVVDNIQLDEQAIILDQDALLIGAQCDISQCSGTSAFHQVHHPRQCH